MPSFADLIDQVISTLHGHTTDQPALGSLIGGITSSSTELAVDFGDQPGGVRPNGFIEIGRELIAVNRYDPSTGLITCSTWSRGQRGTAAAAHNAGDMVTVRPRYPRQHVANTINQVLASSCPPLFAPRDLSPITFDDDILGYPLPDDTIRVLRVDVTNADSTARAAVRNWSVRTVAGQQLLEVPDRFGDGVTLQATIAANPGRMVDDGDDFATVTGLPESLADLAVFGAIARLILAADLPRQQVLSAEAAQRGDRIGVGSGTSISRYYQALYTQRLEAERDRLQQTYPLQLLRRG